MNRDKGRATLAFRKRDLSNKEVRLDFIKHRHHQLHPTAREWAERTMGSVLAWGAGDLA